MLLLLLLVAVRKQPRQWSCLLLLLRLLLRWQWGIRPSLPQNELLLLLLPWVLKIGKLACLS